MKRWANLVLSLRDTVEELGGVSFNLRSKDAESEGRGDLLPFRDGGYGHSVAEP